VFVDLGLVAHYWNFLTRKTKDRWMSETVPNKDATRFNLARNWRALLLGLLVGIQFILLFKNYIYDHLQPAPERLRLTAFERSGTGVFGEDGYAYLTFLREVVPEDGSLVIPLIRPDRERERRAMWHVTGVMEHFLMPRKIVQCACTSGIEECQACLKGAEAYVIDLGAYPPLEREILDLGFLPFDSGQGFFRGVYTPISMSGQD
jgi:hypothetical protein